MISLLSLLGSLLALAADQDDEEDDAPLSREEHLRALMLSGQYELVLQIVEGTSHPNWLAETNALTDPAAQFIVRFLWQTWQQEADRPVRTPRVHDDQKRLGGWLKRDYPHCFGLIDTLHRHTVGTPILICTPAFFCLRWYDYGAHNLRIPTPGFSWEGFPRLPDHPDPWILWIHRKETHCFPRPRQVDHINILGTPAPGKNIPETLLEFPVVSWTDGEDFPPQQESVTEKPEFRQFLQQHHRQIYWIPAEWEQSSPVLLDPATFWRRLFALLPRLGHVPDQELARILGWGGSRRIRQLRELNRIPPSGQ